MKLKKIFKYCLIFIFLMSCDKDIDKVFVDKRIEKLFVEFVDEAKNSPYKGGNKIFVSVYGEISDEQFCLSFENAKYYNSDEKYSKFNHQGFKVYVNENVPKSIVQLNKFDENAKFNLPEGVIPSIREFLELWICVNQDSLKVKYINFENKEWSESWEMME